MERRLAAILAADVVGYSRLMGEDEAGTLDALRASWHPQFLTWGCQLAQPIHQLFHLVQSHALVTLL